ncbi:hypothetical protein F5B19DRAFT_488312 [Rostrohypoxylon terebratum]|nr:hypothetical protein F5B19DRAFT_488312 [Rostrohypoxylon terebratum]
MEPAAILWVFIAAALLEFSRLGWALEDNCTGTLVSDTLPVLVEQDNIHRHLQRLHGIAHASDGSRMVSSAGHNQTIEYIKNELSNSGYYVEVQKVDEIVPVTGNATLIVDSHPFQIEPIGWSPSANLSNLPIVAVKEYGCHEYDYPEDSKGAVVLVNGRGCPFSHKSVTANRNGAAAMLIYEDEELTSSFGGPSSSYVPSATISTKEIDAMTEDRRTLQIDHLMISAKLQRIHRSECGNDENTLMVGTHTDSASATVGINDNASGIASLLEVATQLTKFRTKSRVKFAFWTAAEPSLAGSKHYIRSADPEELRKLRLYLDVNMVGSPNGALKVYDALKLYHGYEGRRRDIAPPGSVEAQDILKNGFHVQGVDSIMGTGISNRSDYASFYTANIPFAGIFSGANGIKTTEEATQFGGTAGEPYDPNYHQPQDDLSNINMTTLVMNTKALAHAVSTYGKGFDEFRPNAIITGGAWRYTTAVKHSTLIMKA